MKNIFHSLRRKFTISVVIMGCVFLICVLAGIIGVVYRGYVKDFNRQLATLFRNAESGEETNPLVGVLFTVNSEGVISAPDSQLDEELLQRFFDKISGNPIGGFFLDGEYYIFKGLGVPEGVTYAVIKYTSQRNYMITLIFISVIVFASGTVVIVTVAFFASKRAVRPVEEAFGKQRELIANASHELKTPLAIISANLSAMTEDKQKTVGENEKWLSAVEDSVARMDKLVADMLELSRMEHNGVIVTDRVNVSETVRGCMLSVEAICYDKDVLLEDKTCDGVFAVTEKATLEKIIYILLDNAIKYTPRDGRVTVTLTHGKKNVLKVRNSGDGIPGEKLDKIFDRFYRTDESRRFDSDMSFGLGLAIAKAAADRIGARISVESKENEYVEFALTF
ncbi:MAG: sensor histidine kinase [Christensenellales bacterium]